MMEVDDPGGGAGPSNGEKSDPVVREIDVYLSTTLSDKLHLVQYPNRPFYRPYDLPVSARVKPKNHVLELAYDVPRAGQHYDDEAPRHLRISHMKLESSFVDPLTTYAIGTIQGNELHLTPVHGVFQMRPSTAHVDASAEEEVEELPDEDENSDEEGEGGGSKAKQSAPVKLQHLEYKKQESKKAMMAKRATWAYKKQLEEAEAWVPLTVNGMDSAASAEEYDKMFCPEMDRVIKLNKESGVLADMIHAASRREAEGEAGSFDQQLGMVTAASSSSEASGAAGGRSATQGLVGLQGSEQVQATLEKAGVVSFAQLLDLGGPEAKPLEILEHVKMVAVLVRGNWVRKSSLYGLPPRLTDARDAMLITLERYGGLNRFQVAAGMKLPEDDVLELLKGFATLDKLRRMWKLKIPDDAGFLNLYPAVAAQQARMWVQKERELHSYLSVLGKPDTDFPGPLAAPPVPPAGPSSAPAPPVAPRAAAPAPARTVPPGDQAASSSSANPSLSVAVSGPSAQPAFRQSVYQPPPTPPSPHGSVAAMEVDEEPPPPTAAPADASGKGKARMGEGGGGEAEGGGRPPPPASSSAPRRPATLLPGQRMGGSQAGGSSVKKFKPKSKE